MSYKIAIQDPRLIKKEIKMNDNLVKAIISFLQESEEEIIEKLVEEEVEEIVSVLRDDRRLMNNGIIEDVIGLIEESHFSRELVKDFSVILNKIESSI